MNLFYVLLNIHEFPNDQLIYVEPPWTLESAAKVQPNLGHVAQLLNFDALIFSYFLNVTTVKNLTSQSEHHQLCMSVDCQRIIEYALQNPAL